MLLMASYEYVLKVHAATFIIFILNRFIHNRFPISPFQYGHRGILFVICCTGVTIILCGSKNDLVKPQP